jgi:ABC-type multidrug transport system ATPase subunit
MGVCPQFDVLWQQLSGREHLLIYGLVKGLSFDQVCVIVTRYYVSFQHQLLCKLSTYNSGLSCMRPLMGVCPQFDGLWQQLSGREHLLIYGLVKGLSFDQVGAGSSFRNL